MVEHLTAMHKALVQSQHYKQTNKNPYFLMTLSPTVYKCSYLRTNHGYLFIKENLLSSLQATFFPRHFMVQTGLSARYSKETRNQLSYQSLGRSRLYYKWSRCRRVTFYMQLFATILKSSNGWQLPEMRSKVQLKGLMWDTYQRPLPDLCRPWHDGLHPKCSCPIAVTVCLFLFGG